MNILAHTAEGLRGRIKVTTAAAVFEAANLELVQTSGTIIGSSRTRASIRSRTWILGVGVSRRRAGEGGSETKKQFQTTLELILAASLPQLNLHIIYPCGTLTDPLELEPQCSWYPSHLLLPSYTCTYPVHIHKSRAHRFETGKQPDFWVSNMGSSVDRPRCHDANPMRRLQFLALQLLALTVD